MLDIVTGPEGPEVIENNPTPSFEPGLGMEGFDLLIGAMLQVIENVPVVTTRGSGD